MGFSKITDEMMAQYPGVIGQATVPKMSVAEKQAAFEQRAEKVLRPAHDKLVDELAAASAAANIGAAVPEGMTANKNVQAVLEALHKEAAGALPAASAANFLRVVSFDASTGTLTTATGVG